MNNPGSVPVMQNSVHGSASISPVYMRAEISEEERRRRDEEERRRRMNTPSQPVISNTRPGVVRGGAGGYDHTGHVSLYVGTNIAYQPGPGSRYANPQGGTVQALSTGLAAASTETKQATYFNFDNDSCIESCTKVIMAIICSPLVLLFFLIKYTIIGLEKCCTWTCKKTEKCCEATCKFVGVCLNACCKCLEKTCDLCSLCLTGCCECIAKCMGLMKPCCIATCDGIAYCCNGIATFLTPCCKAIGTCCSKTWDCTAYVFGNCCALTGKCCGVICKVVGEACTYLCSAFEKCCSVVCSALGVVCGKLCDCLAVVFKYSCLCLEGFFSIVGKCCTVVCDGCFLPFFKIVSSCCEAMWVPCCNFSKEICSAVGGCLSVIGKAMGECLKCIFSCL